VVVRWLLGIVSKKGGGVENVRRKRKKK